MYLVVMYRLAARLESGWVQQESSRDEEYSIVYLFVVVQYQASRPKQFKIQPRLGFAACVCAACGKGLPETGQPPANAGQYAFFLQAIGGVVLQLKKVGMLNLQTYSSFEQALYFTQVLHPAFIGYHYIYSYFATELQIGESPH